MIVDVKSIVENKKIEIKERVKNLNKKGIYPKLAIVKANSDEASMVYVKKKRQMCEEIGILEEECIFDETATTEDIVNKIKSLNEDNSVNGILVQLPLYKHLDEKAIINSISSDKDADGLTSLNFGNLINGSYGIEPCTPKGIVTILDSLNVDYVGKNVVVIGRSMLVGKPIAIMLLAKGATVTICHSKTKELSEHTKNADILVVAVGHEGLIEKDMVKDGAIVIDVGINRTENGIKGDVITDEVNEVAKYVTPVPGGVGLTTVLSLLENVVQAARMQSDTNKMI